MNLWIVVIIMGLVEGITEFIPVSSTGHLILADHFLNFKEYLGDSQKAAMFEVVIQLGAILAIAIIYWKKLWGVGTRGLFQPGEDRRLLISLVLGFIPAAIVGVLFDDWIEEHLFSEITVAWALLVGGFVILIIERFAPQPTSRSTQEMTYRQAFAVGIAQVFSLFPGTSRSGATIMGGLCAGLDRRTATEYSFLLSFPIMLAATALKLFKGYKLLDAQMLGVLSVGFVVSFICAWIVVKWLIRFVQSHNFTVFAIYRILIGAALIYLFWPKKA